MREEIAALFDRRDAAWRLRDASALAADHALDGVVVSPTGGVLRGGREIERIYRVWFTAFSDFAFTAEACSSTTTAPPSSPAPAARTRGSSSGCRPPAGASTSACGFFYRFEGSFIAHERRILDFTGLLVQVGVLRAKPAGGR